MASIPFSVYEVWSSIIVASIVYWRYIQVATVRLPPNSDAFCISIFWTSCLLRVFYFVANVTNMSVVSASFILEMIEHNFLISNPACDFKKFSNFTGYPIKCKMYNFFLAKS